MEAINAMFAALWISFFAGFGISSGVFAGTKFAGAMLGPINIGLNRTVTTLNKEADHD